MAYRLSVWRTAFRYGVPRGYCKGAVSRTSTQARRERIFRLATAGHQDYHDPEMVAGHVWNGLRAREDDLPDGTLNHNAETIAFVTGANKGLGREIARQLAAKGIFVLMGARDRERGVTAAA